MIDYSWKGLPYAERKRLLAIKELELERKRQERRGLEIKLELIDREVRKIDVEANDLRASLKEPPKSN